MKTGIQTSLDCERLGGLVTRQVESVFPDGNDVRSLTAYVGGALKRLEHSFSHTRRSPFWDGQRPVFNHLHGDQYAMFLYMLSSEMYRMKGERQVAEKIYLLNKTLNGIDIFYEVAMPDIFCLQHTVGTVVGRATMSDYLFLYQRVTIGGNLDLVYPKIDEGVVLFGNSALIGATTVGPNTLVSIGTTVVDETLKGQEVVFGRSPNLIRKVSERDVKQRFFGR